MKLLICAALVASCAGAQPERVHVAPPSPPPDPCAADAVLVEARALVAQGELLRAREAMTPDRDRCQRPLFAKISAELGDAKAVEALAPDDAALRATAMAHAHDDVDDLVARAEDARTRKREVAARALFDRAACALGRTAATKPVVEPLSSSSVNVDGTRIAIGDFVTDIPTRRTVKVPGFVQLTGHRARGVGENGNPIVVDLDREEIVWTGAAEHDFVFDSGLTAVVWQGEDGTLTLADLETGRETVLARGETLVTDRDFVRSDTAQLRRIQIGKRGTWAAWATRRKTGDRLTIRNMTNGTEVVVTRRADLEFAEVDGANGDAITAWTDGAIVVTHAGKTIATRSNVTTFALGIDAASGRFAWLTDHDVHVLTRTGAERVAKADSYLGNTVESIEIADDRIVVHGLAAGMHEPFTDAIPLVGPRSARAEQDDGDLSATCDRFGVNCFNIRGALMVQTRGPYAVVALPSLHVAVLDARKMSLRQLFAESSGFDPAGFDDRRVWGSDADGRVRIWDIESGRVVWRNDAHAGDTSVCVVGLRAYPIEVCGLSR
jgi:hypothetical protein